jgi:8-oxo-dGTP diphosphatase
VTKNVTSVSESSLREQAKKDGVAHLSTGIAILKDGKVLIVRRVKDDFLGGYYELPGGGVDEGESIAGAAKREVLEETGLRVSKLIGTFQGFDYSTDKKPHVRQVNFLVGVEPGDIVLSDEHDAYLWVDSKAIDNLGMTDKMRQCVRRAVGVKPI